MPTTAALNVSNVLGTPVNCIGKKSNGQASAIKSRY